MRKYKSNTKQCFFLKNDMKKSQALFRQYIYYWQCFKICLYRSVTFITQAPTKVKAMKGYASSRELEARNQAG